MKILNQDQIKEAAEILSNGGLIAFPTETVFGFGVIYDNKSSYDRLIAVKRRPPEKPFTLMLSDIEQIEQYAYLDERAKKLINKYMPGQFTIIVKAKDCLPSYCVSKEGNVGIRISSDNLIRNLIREVGKPLLVPSANKSGEPPLTNSDDVISIFINEIDGIIVGESVSNVPSTIVMIDEDVKVIREGLIKKEDIFKTLGEQNMKISIGCDHAGYKYKEEIKRYLTEKGYEVLDCGTNSLDSCDYPIFGRAAAELVAKGDAKFGIVVCSSGEGIMMAANKIKGVRCGLAYNDDVARLIRQHNNANMIGFGANFMALEDVLRRIDIFLATEFEGGRHERRVNEIE